MDNFKDIYCKLNEFRLEINESESIIEYYNLLREILQVYNSFKNVEKNQIEKDYIEILTKYGEICCKMAGGVNEQSTNKFSDQEEKLFHESLASFKNILDNLRSVHRYLGSLVNNIEYKYLNSNPNAFKSICGSLKSAHFIIASKGLILST